MKNIYSISFLIVSILLFFICIDPFYGQVKQLKLDIDTYNKALNNSTELQKKRDNLVEQFNSIKQEDKDRLYKLLPNNIGNIELILEIEKLAGLHGMPIGDIRFDSKGLESNVSGASAKTVVATNDNLPYNVFPMNFTIEGKYDTFVSFLKDLEKNLRIVDLRSVSFKPTPKIVGDKNSTSDIYNYILKVQTYWLR